MTTRELFRNIMHYREFDRMPVWHWAGWAETTARWIEEGLPEDPEQHHAFFDAEPVNTGIAMNAGLSPHSLTLTSWAMSDISLALKLTGRSSTKCRTSTDRSPSYGAWTRHTRTCSGSHRYPEPRPD